MPQGVLNFKYEVEKTALGLTALAGIPVVLDLAAMAGLLDFFRKYVHLKSDDARWSVVSLSLELILLNLVGGDCVEDVAVLEGDPGLRKLLLAIETFWMKRKEARALRRRREKEEKRAKKAGRPLRALPCRTVLRDFLKAFHSPDEEDKREPKKAFIPAPNEHLLGLRRVNQGLVAFLQQHAPHRTATLDMDATLIETTKQTAYFCYKHFRAYQPFQVYWYEQKVLLLSEFRDGNVNAGFDQLRVLEESLDLLPEGVEKVFARSDTAGYQWDFLKYCAEGKNARFGVIEFAVSADVTQEFREAVAKVALADWHPLPRTVNGKTIETGQEWAEVCYVPQEACRSKNGPEYRFLAIREPFETEPSLPGLDAKPDTTPEQLPFPTMELGPTSDKRRYKLFGVVTNRLDMPGDQLVWWLRERCGKSEEVHAILKNDLAGGQLPSALFGANAAWWAFVVISFNLLAVLKALVLGKDWVDARLKRLRFHLFRLPGQVLFHARQLTVRLSPNNSALPWLLDLRQKILTLATPPPAPA